MHVTLTSNDAPWLDSIHEFLERKDYSRDDGFNRLGTLIAAIKSPRDDTYPQPPMVPEFSAGDRVVIAPDFSNDGFVPFEGTVVGLDDPDDANPMIVVKNDDGEESSWLSGNVNHQKFPQTKWPVRHNHKPTEEEVHNRRAIHVLFKSLGEDEMGTNLILMQDSALGVYLVPGILTDADDDESGGEEPEPRPDGTVEYQVCNGLPDERTFSHDFYSLAEAKAHFNEVVAAGGWKKWQESQKK